MDNIMETLSITLSLVAFFTPFALIIIIYLIKRNGFYVSANCWFCNSWTRVLYSNRNSFYCPSCQQYNGFDQDGGYNKVIEAQHDTSFNKYNKTTRKTEPLTNGLCTYCNNNQQLKVYQLAHFVPLNETNYDVEVEHFQRQLEKAYKLCKKCDKVLKTTIEKQHAWIFGNRLKSLRKKGLSLLNKSPQRIYNQIKQSFFINVVRYLLILFSIFILCHTLDVKINHNNGELEKYVPDVFVPYTMLVSDLYTRLYNITTRNINKDIQNLNFYLPKNIKLKANNLLPVACVGFLLEIVLLIGDRRPFWWKVNETLGWTVLVISSSVVFQDRYVVYIKTLQISCSFAIICSLLATSNSKRKERVTRKFEFKKLRRSSDDTDSSDVDEELPEETSSSFTSSKKSNTNKSFKGKNDPNTTFRQWPNTFSQGSIFQNNMQSASKLNNSFATARSTKSTSVFNSSFKGASNKSYSSELHHSLDNLHLSNLNLKPQICASPVFSDNLVNRPILSPPKLKNVTQNSWTAGGFWKNDATLYPTSTDYFNLSRSSSQSSGFVSNNEPPNPNPRFSSLPSSREPSFCGDYERSSILSEPAYHFKPIHSKTSRSKNGFDYTSSRIASSPNSGQLYYKAENNTFYPVLNQNNMLLIQGANIPRQFESSFSNLSLRSFNTNRNFNTRILFGERPVISSLFKNLPELSSQSHCFRAPHC